MEHSHQLSLLDEADPDAGQRPTPVGTSAGRKVLDELFARIRVYRSSRAYAELLNFVAKFTRYSPFNGFLLHLQNPDVTYVASAHQWRERFGRTVKPQARAMVVVSHRALLSQVYDLTDTEGPELPENWQAPFETRGELSELIWQRTVMNCRQDRIAVLEKELSQLHAGSAVRIDAARPRRVRGRPVPSDYAIQMDRSLELPARYSTLVHELGHIYCGHLGTNARRRWPDRRGLSDEQMEIEAESVAFVVCERRGLSTKSPEYLARYAHQDIRRPDLSLEMILRVAGKIEAMGERILPERTGRTDASDSAREFVGSSAEE